MPARHIALACLVAALWGVNFLAIHASLQQFPPIFLVALRFTLLAVPTLLLVPRPDVPTRWLLGYGVGFGIVQFLGLYLGMEAGSPRSCCRPRPPSRSCSARSSSANA